MKLFPLLLVTLLLLCGCPSRREGPAERAGERVDEIVDNVREGDAPLKKKGAMERAGESIDRAIDGDND